MSLDETARNVWQTKRPPLAMLVAGRATEMLATPLDEAIRAPFSALARAVEAWEPKRKRKPEDIYANEMSACVDAAAAHPAASAALRGAHVQMAALLQVAPRSLPPGDHYQYDEDDFVALLRDAAKVGKLSLAQLEARLKHLLAHPKEPWPQLVARVDRMHWGRCVPWGKLEGRVRDLASLADLGATWTWQDVGGQRALRLELDGTKRIAVLSDEELEALQRVVPGAAGEPTA